MPKKIWTEETDRFLIENYRSFSVQDLADKLDKSYASIKNRAARLGLSKRRIWSNRESEYLDEMLGQYPFDRVVVS